MLSKKEETDSILAVLKKKYKLKIEEANFAHGFIPNYILLDRTRNIHSYLVPIGIDIVRSFENTTSDLSGNIELLKEYYKIQYSQLDRPLFLLFEDERGIEFLDISNLKKYLLREESFKEFLDNRIKIDYLFPILKTQL